jgi:hypothetical protein
MNAPIYVVPPPPVPLPDTPPAQPPAREVAQLLRQLIGLQQEQVGLLKAQAVKEDNGSRWKAFLARWAEEFPGIGAACKQTVPVLERAYLTLVRELTDRVNATEVGELDDEFVLGEFLDRFGIRLSQLANIIGQLGPLADAAPTSSEEKG